MAIEVLARRYRVGQVDAEEVDLSDGPIDHRDAKQLLWIDVTADAERSREAIAGLDEQLGLDGALDDVARQRRPSVRFLDEALSLTVVGIVEVEDGEGRPQLLHLVAAPNLVVSLHDGPLPDLERPIRIVAADPRFGRLDAGTFLGLLLDGMIDSYFREVEATERVIDELDTRALEDRDLDRTLAELVAVRSRIARLRRRVAPQREVFTALLRPVDQDQPSTVGWPWSGLPERLERVLDAIENAREELIGTFDLVSTRSGEHTNDVMKVLTVVSSLLLPSVVIAGVMGMNFKVPFFDDPGNFFLIVGVMVALAIGTLVVAKMRHWI